LRCQACEKLVGALEPGACGFPPQPGGRLCKSIPGAFEQPDGTGGRAVGGAIDGPGQFEENHPDPTVPQESLGSGESLVLLSLDIELQQIDSIDGVVAAKRVEAYGRHTFTIAL